MDGRNMTGPTFSKEWRKRIGDNLPRTLDTAHRIALTRHIEESIRRWLAIEPEITPHREKLKRLAAAVDKLQSALYRARRIAATFVPEPEVAPLITTAEGRLYLLAKRAEEDLASWNRQWRPKKARPKKFSVSLTGRLQDEYRLFCGNLHGFKNLLVVINAERRKHYPTVPELTVTALEKRKQRRR